MIIDYIQIYNEYQADQRDGFVSNIDSYVDSKYSFLSKEYRDKIKALIKDQPEKSFKEYTCKHCDNVFTSNVPFDICPSCYV